MRYRAFISYSHAADGKLAPALQSALRRFAQPWYRPRSVRVFRDDTNLSVSPGLWTSIESALSESEYFLLLASPQASGSKWVRREVDYWLKHRSPQKLLIVLTEGEIVWDSTAVDFDWNKTDALPENLAKAFAEEPLYLDFRWAKTAAEVSLNNPRFLDQIAALASPLHGRSKEDLIGEDVLEHRRTKRWAWSAGVVLLILTVLSSLATIVALQQKKDADRQRAQALGLQLAAQAETKRIRQANLLQESVADAVKAMRHSPSDQAYQTLRRGLELLPASGGVNHDDNVTAVAFSPDGQFVATASFDRSAWIWKSAGQETIARLNHEGVVWALDFSKDGKYLATASWDGLAAVWDASSGRRLAQMPHQKHAVTAVAFSPDGRFLATASEDKVARLWEWALEREKKRLDHKDHLTAVAFSPNGKFLVTASDDKTARVWEPATGQQIATLEHGTGVTAIAFSRDGNTLATATRDGTAQAWDVASGRKISQPITHGGTIWSLAFNPTGKYLATASRDKTARVWELPSGKQVARLDHEDFVWKVTFSPDGQHVATASRDHTARVWEVASGAEIMRMIHQDNVTGVTFSPDGKSLVTASDDNHARVWQVRSTEPLLIHKSDVIAITISPDNQSFATAGRDATVRLWDGINSVEKLLAHRDIMSGVAFSPDGKQLATASWDGTVNLWDVASRQRLMCLNCVDQESHEPKMRLNAVAFSPDGRWLAAGGDKTTQLFEPSKSSPARRQLKTEEDVQALAFSPDGKYLATAGEKGALLWEMSSGKQVGQMPHVGTVTHVAFSPNGNYFVTAKNDGTAELWEVPSGRRVGCLGCNDPNPTVGFTAVTFSPDGKHLAVASVNGAARLWAADTGRQIAQFNLPEDLWALTFSTDRRYLVVAKKDQRAQALLFWPDDVNGEACKRLTILACDPPVSSQSPGFLRSLLSFSSSAGSSLRKSLTNLATSLFSTNPPAPLDPKQDAASASQVSKLAASYAVQVNLNGKPIPFVASKDGSELSRSNAKRPELVLTPGKYALQAGKYEINQLFSPSCVPSGKRNRLFEQFLDKYVNAENGNFYFPKAAGDFDLRYNSRSLYDGPFGFGWTFETRIERRSGGNLVVHEVDDNHSEYRADPSGLYESTTPFPSVIVEEASRLIRYIKDDGYQQRYGRPVLVEVFDSQGRLRSVRFANGEAHARRNNKAERLSSIVNQWTGETIYAFERDASGGRIAGLRDSTGRNFRFTYDDNRLVAKTAPSGAVEHYSYDEAFNLVEFRDQNSSIKLGYDALRDYLVKVDGPEMRYHFRYGAESPEHQWTIRTDNNGNFVRWDYYYRNDTNETLKMTANCLETK